jgi:hypothetical protein
MNTPTIEVKNYHSLNTHDGVAFTCSVYVDGKKAFLAENDGMGSENLYIVLDKELFTLASEYAESLPDVECEGFDFTAPSDLDFVIGAIIDRMDEDKQLKRLCKAKTLFRLPGDKDGAWRTMDLKFDETTKNIILYKYPAAEIANLRFQ